MPLWVRLVSMNFWTRYMLDLLVVIAAASLAALLAASVDEEVFRMFLIIATGIAGGLWLYWWRDHRDKKKAPADGRMPPAGDGGSGTPGFG